MFQLNGHYTLENIEELQDLLKGVTSKIDYSNAKIDLYVKVILDSINSNIQVEEEKIKPNILSLQNFLHDTLVYSYELFLMFKAIFGKVTRNYHSEFLKQDLKAAFYNMSIQAVPITVFLGMLLGINITMQSAQQLRMFGCEIYALDLLVYSFFKEMGLLIAILVLTGRSGASFISKIGFIKIGDEWNSLQVMKIDPHVFLLQPVVLSFSLSMLFLGYVACFSGIIGGCIVLGLQAKLSFMFFFEALLGMLDYKSFLSILLKGPIFGFFIGIVSALEAVKSEINSSSVIKGISKGVIYSICFCVFLDFLFNLFIFGF